MFHDNSVHYMLLVIDLYRGKSGTIFHFYRANSIAINEYQNFVYSKCS
jgi:hypothetical protein